MLYALGFILLFAILCAVIIVQLKEAKKQRQRVMSLIGAEAPQDKIKKQKNAQNNIGKTLEAVADQQKASSKKGQKKSLTIATLIAQAGMTISVKTFWIRAGIFAAIFTFILKLIGASPFVLIMGGFIGFLGLPKLFLKIKAGKRQKKFLDDFADALEAIVRLLKAGMPVTEAIAMVSREYEGPVGEEMKQVYEAQKVGMSLPEAVLQAARRMPIPEMNMLATGITIQAQTGSSLSNALMNLSGLIRARYRLKRKVVALSSEATASASIIGALPILVGGALFLINPEYTGVLFTTPLGKMLVFGAISWMCVGILMMRQMINFKV
ncbi:MAG: type II secretion protein F [Micavibrio sp.]|nr:type II secretion protein F [Micavibrio sp.]